MSSYTDKTVIPFGKYKGEMIANVPASYLLYLYEENIAYGELKSYIEDNMVTLKTQRASDTLMSYNKNSRAR